MTYGPAFYVKLTENDLKNYIFYKASIKNKESEINAIKEMITLSCESTYSRMEDISLVGLVQPAVESNFVIGLGPDGEKDVIVGMQQQLHSSSSHYSDSDPTAKTAESIITHPRIKLLEFEIICTKNLIARIDRAYEVLSELEQKIVRLRYFQRKQWKEIADLVNLSERQARTWNNKAVKRIAVGLYGEKAARRGYRKE